MADPRLLPPMRGLYMLFSLPRDATGDEIRAKHRDLAKYLHPDKNPQFSSSKFAPVYFVNDLMAVLNNARDLLVDAAPVQSSEKRRLGLHGPKPKWSCSYDETVYYKELLRSSYDKTVYYENLSHSSYVKGQAACRDFLMWSALGGLVFGICIPLLVSAWQRRRSLKKQNRMKEKTKEKLVLAAECSSSDEEASATRDDRLSEAGERDGNKPTRKPRKQSTKTATKKR